MIVDDLVHRLTLRRHRAVADGQQPLAGDLQSAITMIKQLSRELQVGRFMSRPRADEKSSEET